MRDPLSKALFTGDSGLAKANSKINPLGAYLATGNRGKLDPLNFNNAPVVLPIPPPPQNEKDPDTMATRRRNNKVGVGAGTLLTGSSGLTYGALNTSGRTLLGG